MNKTFVWGIYRKTPFLISIFLIFYCWNVYWGGMRYKTFFLSDSNGYYAYLPATFIYEDYRFGFIEDAFKKYFSTSNGFDFRQNQENGIVNKWHCGTAVAIAPFFLLSHFISQLTGNSADGYSFWYAWGLNIAAIFYCLAGLLALQKILRKFFKSEALIAFALVLTVFATNLFYYITSEPAMSHVYSFAFVNLFALCSLNFFETLRSKFFVLMSFLLAMIIIIRPVNGIIVFILPFLAGNMDNLKTAFISMMKEKVMLLFSLLVFSIVIFIQLNYYRLQTGNWLVYSYGSEKMNFTDPHLIDFLFSYKKGLFVWAPLTFLSLTGFIFLYRISRFRFYALAVFLLLTWYAMSCWWNWWYGGSFGMRPMIEYLFAFALLICYAMENLKAITKKIFVTLCIFCLLLCQVQTYQYRYYFIHWDKMDKESYWKVFMRIDLVIKKENPNAELLK